MGGGVSLLPPPSAANKSSLLITRVALVDMWEAQLPTITLSSVLRREGEGRGGGTHGSLAANEV